MEKQSQELVVEGEKESLDNDIVWLSGALEVTSTPTIPNFLGQW